MSRSGDTVEDGTNAGWRNPFLGRALPWQCACVVADPAATCICYPGECPQGCEPACPRCKAGVRKTNIGPLAACPDCGERRPS